MSRIRNLSSLLDHGRSETRSVALSCLDAALAAADTYPGTRRVVHREGDRLTVGDQVFDLRSLGKIYVVGAGKGSYPIAKALDEILGDDIEQGMVMVKDPNRAQLEHIQVIHSGHPVPNQASLDGGNLLRKLAAGLGPRDLVFAAMTGGCSALLALPVPGVSLEDKIAVNRLLLRTGARIGEMNAVRKHLSLVKGGGLIKLLQPATVVTLTQDTAPDSLPWPDPSLPDPSTFADAVAVLKYYEIWEQVPQSVRNYLEQGLADPGLETPKSFEGWRTFMYDTGNQRDACLAAVAKARELGYQGAVLSTKLEGESRELGIMLAGIAKEIQLYGRPFTAPFVLVSAGESTVSVRDENGRGGPNMETVLGFARYIDGYPGVALAAIDSEGTDGPTEVAGGVADDLTLSRSLALGLDLKGLLKRNDSLPGLEALGDTVITGATGTNVVNLRVLVVEKRR